jgi:hypothetical protein
MSGPVYIRIDRPEEYDDVADELLIEDWIGCLKSGALSAETGGFDWQQVAAPRRDHRRDGKTGSK